VENVEPDVDQHLAGLLESLPEAFVWLDRQGHVTYLNQQAECLLQHPREALLGQTLWEAFPEAVGARFDRQSPAAGAPPTACHFEAFSPVLHKWLEIHTSPAKHGMAVAFRDITPYKRVEAELFTLAAIVESSEDAIYSKTPDELVLSWNKGAERLYGYRAHEMIGQPVQALVPPERRPELAAIMQRLTEHQRLEHFETVRRRKDGQLIDVSVTISPVKDATGTIVGASTIAREITARKQMEDHLRRSEQRFRALIEQSADGIVLVDPQGRVFYASPSTTRLLGSTPEALVGRRALELIHPR
jgi:PAS domain S-box-containing protein